MTSHLHLTRQGSVEFALRDPSRFGRRVCYTAAFALGYVAFPFLGAFGLGCLLFLLVPALFGAALGRFVTAIRDARALRRALRTPPGLRRLRRA